MDSPGEKTARYRLKREDHKKNQISALQWLVSLDSNYGNSDGEPNYTRIAEAGRLSLSTVSLLARGRAELGMDSFTGLMLAGRLAGATEAECIENLFDFLPPAGFTLRLELVAA